MAIACLVMLVVKSKVGKKKIKIFFFSTLDVYSKEGVECKSIFSTDYCCMVTPLRKKLNSKVFQGLIPHLSTTEVGPNFILG